MVKRKKVSFKDIREEILNMKNNEGLTLAEAVEDYASRHDIPLKQIKSHLDENLFQMLKAELDPLSSKPFKRKFYFTDYLEIK